MSVALIAKGDVPADLVGEILTRDGVGPLSVFGVHEVLDGRKTVGDADLVFLISTQDFTSAGGAVSRVHERLGRQELVLCITPSPFNDQRRLLLSYGAHEVISPAGPHADQIAERILGHVILRRRVTRYNLGNVLGASPAMQEVYEQIGSFASLELAVLLRGETGTGKELVAEVLHSESKRKGAFVRVDSTTLNSGTVESDLFGHKKGSFTGANAHQMGLIETAHEGTVFIDEIGDCAPGLQGKLLDVIDYHRVRPVGANQYKEVDVRFIFATHRDLESFVREDKFRQDLLARIDVLTIRLPPLRHRKADIPLLVEHFINDFNKKYKKVVKLEGDAVDELFRYDWARNVRGLRNAVHRSAAAAGADGAISNFALSEDDREPMRRPDDSWGAPPLNSVEINPLRDSWPALQEKCKESYFKALAAVSDNMDHASDLAKVGRSQLYEIFRDYSLRISDKIRQRPRTR
jgi:DNA-binding NtrC family response regulator